MSGSFLPMMATVAGAVLAYYLWAFKLGLDENAGLLVSTLTAILLATIFYRIKNKKNG